MPLRQPAYAAPAYPRPVGIDLTDRDLRLAIQLALSARR